MTNVFNHYFCDHSSVDDSSTNTPEQNTDEIIPTLDNIIITQKEVYGQPCQMCLRQQTPIT